MKVTLAFPMRCAGAKRRIFFWFYLSWDAVFLLSLTYSANQNNNFECYTLPISIFEFRIYCFKLFVWTYRFNSGLDLPFQFRLLPFHFQIWIYRFNSGFELKFTVSIPSLDLPFQFRIWIYLPFQFGFEFTVSISNLDLRFISRIETVNANPKLKR